MVRGTKTLVIDGATYTYAICKNSDVVVYDPSGKKHLIAFVALTGFHPSQVYNERDDWFQGGKRSKTEAGTITKRQIEVAIRKGLLK